MSPSADRNLLFGILALQMDFIGRDALIAAMHAWVLDKRQPLGAILVAQQALAEDERAALDTLVQKHLGRHGGDPEQSLAAVGLAAPVHERLQELVDTDVQASLVHLPATCERPSDLPATTAYTATPPGQRFAVLRPHAQGGLGQVLVALDRELNREVALKEMRDQYAHDADKRGRFVREAEITGGLEHPGIVPVYGLGAHPDGRPYYAMRFIRGDSLQQHIKRFHQADTRSRELGERTLALRQLLRRFIDVCNTVAYAHSRGVLHRDLKPGNIMLGPYGETLVVDWGLAKPMSAVADKTGPDDEPALQPGSSLTETVAGSALGTPAYMSPEQAAGRLDLLGPASDVYSLGATLYHLLTSQQPFHDVQGSDLLRAVERGSFPAPRALDRSIDPALEAICLKAMARSPKDRYAQARDLANDLDHWLADEPVRAWPEPWTAKGRRWISRHRTSVAGAAAAVLALALSLGAATYFLSRANHDLDLANQNERLAKRDALAQKERATQSYRLAREGLEAAVAIKADERLSAGPLEDLKKKLAQAEASFYEKFVTLHGDEAPFRFERAMAYSKLGVATVLLGNRQEAIHDFETAASMLEQLQHEFPDQLQYQDALEQHYNDLGYFLQQLQRFDKAEPALLKAREIQLQLEPRWSKHKSLLWHMGATLTNLGSLYRDTHRMDQAERAFKDALSVLGSATRESPKTGEGSRYWDALANAHTSLGYLYALTGRPSQGIAERQQGIAMWKDLVKADPKSIQLQRNLAMGYHFLGMTYQLRSEWVLAEENYRAAQALRKKLAEQHPALAELKSDLTDTYYQLAWVYQNTGRQDKALVEYPRIISIFEGLHREYPNDPDYLSKLGWAYNDMGILANELQHYRQAEQAHLHCIKIRRDLVKRYAGNTAYESELGAGLNNLGDLYLDTNRLGEAEALYNEALRIRERLHQKYPALAAYAFSVAGTLGNLARLDFQRARFQEAAEHDSLALKHCLRLVSEDPKNLVYQERVVFIYAHRAQACDALDQTKEASAAQAKAIEYREKMTKAQPSQTGWRIHLGELYAGMGKYVSRAGGPSEALAWYERAAKHLLPLTATRSHGKEAKRVLGKTYAEIAWVQSKQLGRHADAIHHYDQALRLYPEKANGWIQLRRACAVARNGAHADAARTANEIVKRTSLSGSDLKDAACVFALSAASVKNAPHVAEARRAQLAEQYATRAVQLLVKAREAGGFRTLSKDAHWLADPDLDVLRERKDFKELLRRVEAAK